MRRYTEQEIGVVCESRGYTQYTRRSIINEKGYRRTYIKFTCTFGLEHTQLLASMMRGHNCGCKRIFFHENLMHQLLEWWLGHKCSKITRKEIVRITKDSEDAPFEIDIYSREARIGIEVDGDLHRYGWGQRQDLAKSLVLRDQKKDSYFLRNQKTLGILLRISTEIFRGKSIEEIIQIFSNLMPIPRSGESEFVYLGQPLKADVRVEWLRELAAKKGCRLIDGSYTNNTTKHNFECEEHGVFTTTPNYLRDSVKFGCKKCSKIASTEDLIRSLGLLPFEEAKKSASSLRIKTYQEYMDTYRAGQLPKGLPSNPYVVYKRHPDWKGIRDYLGTVTD